MSIRAINYNVTASGIDPPTQQSGGVQGEHNATKLVFSLDTTLLKAIREQSGTADVVYRFDGYTGAGSKCSTEPQTLVIPEGIITEKISIEYSLENWLTRDGGNIQVYLVITALQDEETQLDLYSFPALVKLKNVPDANNVDGINYESISTLSEVARQSAVTAVEAKDVAVLAKEQTVLAHTALTEGAEFIFDGGTAAEPVTVDLVVDAQMSSASENPVQNKVVYAELGTIREDVETVSTELEKVRDEVQQQAELQQQALTAHEEEETEYRNGIADRIVEIGDTDVTNDIGIKTSWHYEKMNSGFVKLWGYSDITLDVSVSDVSRNYGFWLWLPFTLIEGKTINTSVNGDMAPMTGAQEYFDTFDVDNKTAYNAKEVSVDIITFGSGLNLNPAYNPDTNTITLRARVHIEVTGTWKEE